MFIRKDDQEAVYKPHLQNGEGAPLCRTILPKEEAAGSGRLFAVFTLQPGESIGYHTHEGEFEIYYVIRGTGTVTENGEVYELRPGDMAQCKNGSSHGIRNAGNEELEFLAVILYDREKAE